jgi:hypothetical protein
VQWSDEASRAAGRCHTRWSFRAHSPSEAPVVDPQTLDMVGLYLEQLLNAAQGMMKVSRGGTVLHRLYSAIEDDAAAKGQDGRNNLITARNDY